MKSKTIGCDSISAVFPSIVLPCVSSIIVIIIITAIITIITTTATIIIIKGLIPSFVVVKARLS